MRFFRRNVVGAPCWLLPWLCLGFAGHLFADPPPPHRCAPAVKLPTWAEVERAVIERRMRAHKNKKDPVALSLGIDRKTIDTKLRKIAAEAPVGEEDFLLLPDIYHRVPLRRVEKMLILQRMADFNGKKPRVAESLGIHLSTIHRKVTQYESEAGGNLDFFASQYF